MRVHCCCREEEERGERKFLMNETANPTENVSFPDILNISD